jgi:hypothetical protein
MTNPRDEELEWLRAGVNCATVLEKLAAGWALDWKESTKRCLKYRRDNEILIVNHEGRGWWDPLSDAKGDVFSLVQHLDRKLNFGQVRQVLRRFVGIVPSYQPLARSRRNGASRLPPDVRWKSRPWPHQGSPSWRYLVGARALPPAIVTTAAAADVIREGPYDSAWFAHRDDAGRVTHVEIRGPDFKGSLRGGTKVLFRLRGGVGLVTRLLLTEAPIDALSFAAWERCRADTLYAATGGGMGSDTVLAIERIVQRLAASPGAVLASATDANRAGERYAAHHARLAREAGIAFERIRPPIAEGDWNDVLKAQTAVG